MDHEDSSIQQSNHTHSASHNGANQQLDIQFLAPFDRSKLFACESEEELLAMQEQFLMSQRSASAQLVRHPIHIPSTVQSDISHHQDDRIDRSSDHSDIPSTSASGDAPVATDVPTSSHHQQSSQPQQPRVQKSSKKITGAHAYFLQANRKAAQAQGGHPLGSLSRFRHGGEDASTSREDLNDPDDFMHGIQHPGDNNGDNNGDNDNDNDDDDMMDDYFSRRLGNSLTDPGELSVNLIKKTRKDSENPLDRLDAASSPLTEHDTNKTNHGDGDDAHGDALPPQPVSRGVLGGMDIQSSRPIPHAPLSHAHGHSDSCCGHSPQATNAAPTRAVVVQGEQTAANLGMITQVKERKRPSRPKRVVGSTTGMEGSNSDTTQVTVPTETLSSSVSASAPAPAIVESVPSEPQHPQQPQDEDQTGPAIGDRILQRKRPPRQKAVVSMGTTSLSTPSQSQPSIAPKVTSPAPVVAVATAPEPRDPRSSTHPVAKSQGTSYFARMRQRQHHPERAADQEDVPLSHAHRPVTSGTSHGNNAGVSRSDIENTMAMFESQFTSPDDYADYLETALAGLTPEQIERFRNRKKLTAGQQPHSDDGNDTGADVQSTRTPASKTVRFQDGANDGDTTPTTDDGGEEEASSGNLDEHVQLLEAMGLADPVDTEQRLINLATHQRRPTFQGIASLKDLVDKDLQSETARRSLVSSDDGNTMTRHPNITDLPPELQPHELLPGGTLKTTKHSHPPELQTASQWLMPVDPSENKLISSHVPTLGNRSRNAKHANSQDPAHLAVFSQWVDLRFDLDGFLRFPTEEDDQYVYGVSIHAEERELYHHGNQPGRKGYTLDELMLLARSTTAAQRVLAIDVLRQIIIKARRGLYSLDRVEAKRLVQIARGDVTLAEVSLSEHGINTNAPSEATSVTSVTPVTPSTPDSISGDFISRGVSAYGSFNISTSILDTLLIRDLPVLCLQLLENDMISVYTHALEALLSLVDPWSPHAVTTPTPYSSSSPVIPVSQQKHSEHVHGGAAKTTLDFFHPLLSTLVMSFTGCSPDTNPYTAKGWYSHTDTPIHAMRELTDIYFSSGAFDALQKLCKERLCYVNHTAMVVNVSRAEREKQGMNSSSSSSVASSSDDTSGEPGSTISTGDADYLAPDHTYGELCKDVNQKSFDPLNLTQLCNLDIVVGLLSAGVLGRLTFLLTNTLISTDYQLLMSQLSLKQKKTLVLGDNAEGGEGTQTSAYEQRRTMQQVSATPEILTALTTQCLLLKTFICLAAHSKTASAIVFFTPQLIDRLSLTIRSHTHGDILSIPSATAAATMHPEVERLRLNRAFLTSRLLSILSYAHPAIAIDIQHVIGSYIDGMLHHVMRTMTMGGDGNGNLSSTVDIKTPEVQANTPLQSSQSIHHLLSNYMSLKLTLLHTSPVTGDMMAMHSTIYPLLSRLISVIQHGGYFQPPCLETTENNAIQTQDDGHQEVNFLSLSLSHRDQVFITTAMLFAYHEHVLRHAYVALPEFTPALHTLTQDGIRPYVHSFLSQPRPQQHLQSLPLTLDGQQQTDLVFLLIAAITRWTAKYQNMSSMASASTSVSTPHGGDGADTVANDIDKILLALIAIRQDILEFTQNRPVGHHSTPFYFSNIVYFHTALPMMTYINPVNVYTALEPLCTLPLLRSEPPSMHYTVPLQRFLHRHAEDYSSLENQPIVVNSFVSSSGLADGCIHELLYLYEIILQIQRQYSIAPDRLQAELNGGIVPSLKTHPLILAYSASYFIVHGLLLFSLHKKAQNLLFFILTDVDLLLALLQAITGEQPIRGLVELGCEELRSAVLPLFSIATVPSSVPMHNLDLMNAAHACESVFSSYNDLQPYGKIPATLAANQSWINAAILTRSSTIRTVCFLMSIVTLPFSLSIQSQPGSASGDATGSVGDRNAASNHDVTLSSPCVVTWTDRDSHVDDEVSPHQDALHGNNSEGDTPIMSNNTLAQLLKGDFTPNDSSQGTSPPVPALQHSTLLPMLVSSPSCSSQSPLLYTMLRSQMFSLLCTVLFQRDVTNSLPTATIYSLFLATYLRLGFSETPLGVQSHAQTSHRMASNDTTVATVVDQAIIDALNSSRRPAQSKTRDSDPEASTNGNISSTLGQPYYLLDANFPVLHEDWSPIDSMILEYHQDGHFTDLMAYILLSITKPLHTQHMETQLSLLKHLIIALPRSIRYNTLYITPNKQTVAWYDTPYENTNTTPQQQPQHKASQHRLPHATMMIHPFYLCHFSTSPQQIPLVLVQPPPVPCPSNASANTLTESTLHSLQDSKIPGALVQAIAGLSMDNLMFYTVSYYLSMFIFGADDAHMLSCLTTLIPREVSPHTAAVLCMCLTPYTFTPGSSCLSSTQRSILQTRHQRVRQAAENLLLQITDIEAEDMIPSEAIEKVYTMKRLALYLRGVADAMQSIYDGYCGGN